MKFLTLIFFYIVYQAAFAQQNINSITTKDIKVNGNLEVNSTTKASKPCPAMSESQRDAMTMDETGAARCIYNTNTNQLNIYNGTIWKSAGGGISNWETAFNYALNDVVIYSAKIYQANTAHTSTSFASDIANWTILSNGLPIDLSSEVSGILPMANGGTDKALTPTLGGVIYTDANSMEVLGAGTSGQVLKSNGAAAPTWQDSSNKLQGEKQSEVSFTKLKARNRSVTQTGAGEYLLGDQENLLENGNSEASTLLQGWTCTNSGDFSAETTEPLDGNKSLKVQPLTVGGYTCYQDFNINQNQRGQSLLLSAMVRASGTDTLQICYRENGVATSICSQAVSNGIPATEAIIGSSATSIGYQFTIPYNSLGLVVRMDKFDMRYGTAVTNQPAIGPRVAYTPTFTGFGTVTNINCYGQQVGTNEIVECTFNAWTPTATEARVSLRTGITSMSGIPSISSIGSVAAGGNGPVSIYSLIEPSVSYITFGVQSSGSASLTKANGNALAVAGQSLSFKAIVPIAQYASSVPAYTGRCNDKKNCSTTLAFSRNTSNVISNISPASSTYNPTCSGTTTLICDLTTGNFTVAPKCWARREGIYGFTLPQSASSTTSVTIPIVDAGGAAANYDVRVYCERQGSDFENAFILQQNVALKEYPKLSIPSISSGSEQIRAEYGATINTACTTGTCAYLNQTGTSVTSIAKNGGAGAYRMTLTRTYSKLLCIVNSQASGVVLNPVKASCSNCSTIDFQTYYSSNADSFGMIDCLGTY